MRLLLFCFLSFSLILPAANKPAAKPVAKAAPKAAIRPTRAAALRKPAPTVVRYRSTTTRTPVRQAYSSRTKGRVNPRYARYSRYSRYPASRYRVVTHFRPVMSVPASDMPEDMVAPVENMTAADLQDSFYYRRPDGMIHYAIDIFRPIGSPLFAAVDGTIERLDPNPLGGLVVYLVDHDRRFRYYYAHLSRHEEGLTVGMSVKAGDVLGYCGDTGNAKGTSPHLHFQISNLAGAMVNPYPWLMNLTTRREEIAASE